MRYGRENWIWATGPLTRGYLLGRIFPAKCILPSSLKSCSKMAHSLEILWAISLAYRGNKETSQIKKVIPAKLIIRESTI